MAEAAQDIETPTKEAKGLAHDIESQIKDAMGSRVAHFKEQSDSLTFEGVRRLLEKDLGLEPYALDVHKRLVKQCLLECLDGADSDNASKTSGEMGEKHVKREVADSSEGLHSKKDVKDSEDSPVMGLLTGHKTTKVEHEEAKGSENKEVPSESTIKKAIRKRSSYIKANSEKVTMAGLRRVLEEDLELEKYTLDSYKKFISQQLDDVLKSCEPSEEKLASIVKKNVKKNSERKASKTVGSDESSDSSDSKDDGEEEDEVKPRKKSIPKGKVRNTDVKKRGRPVKETNISSRKRRKAAETIPEENSDAEDGGNVSENGHSESSEEKPVKKKEVSNPAYGKRVEHLKSVIKSCGMSVPPSIYKKVKQAPENKREAHLIKELEEILSKEGLSANPSEKEIKEVRKRKERAKELEGIDMSNIVQSSRRRSTSSFVAPPKPKIPVESKGDDAEDTDKDNDEDDDEEEEVEDDNNDDEEDDDNGGDDDSQSEEFEEDADEDSD